MSLGVEVRPGKEHAAAKGLPGLWQTLEKLPRHQWPAFSRGDCGYGSEAIMLEHEERGLPYLFKLRHTKKVKELVLSMMRKGASWQDCSDGWQALETTLRLSKWSKERRVILVREAPAAPRFANPENPVAVKIAKAICPTRAVRAGTPVPPRGAARSRCLSAVWMNKPFPRWSCPNTTATVPMRKTASTS